MKMKRNDFANRWGEGFPLGNGHMGAMILGSLPKSRILLSENTFYSGEKSLQNNQKQASQAFYAMRQQAEEGRYDKVHEIAEKFIGNRKNYGTNLPVGELIIEYERKDWENYERTLDITRGVAECSFNCKEDQIKEEIFLSHPDKILIYHLKRTAPGSIKISFSPDNTPGKEYGTRRYGEGFLEFTCNAYETMHCDELCGVSLTGYGQVVTDGRTIPKEDGLYLEHAGEVFLYLGMNTDFKRNFIDRTEGYEILSKECREHVKTCIGKDFLSIRRHHKEDMAFYMKKVEFTLSMKDRSDDLIPFLFQYGRYLLLSSSRSDSKLPAHLQGIWNDNVACQIGWTCDMHLDINTQMNYWPAEATNLTETLPPLFHWIKEDLAKAGELTAKESYGLNGWVGELVSNAWGYAAPYWASPIAPCPTGGVWILMQMWEHYRYQEDTVYLRNTAFPFIEGAAVFFKDYVFMDKNSGFYIGGPSISPENSFLYQDKPYQISNGCTYEVVLIRELFRVYLNACELLQLRDTPVYEEIAGKYQALLPYRITEKGTIAEWNHDLPEADTQHRHTSHLLGLYPFSQITPEDTKELCEAAKKTLKAKLTPEENWEDTGWARALLILYEARLHDGNAAYRHIKSMLKNLLEPNNLIYHPPTRGAFAFDHVYELDGNTGLTAGIAEMLLQSHNGSITFLPALPDSWETGKITGLLARGCILVDLFWEKGQLIKAVLVAKEMKTCKAGYKNKYREIRLQENVPYVFQPE